ncbi:restriction endonuclease [Gimesia sp.]|uniref:McrC family protein n=1 Tax=Gimesia sp. TaxID=2024833 RepID=UPI0032ECD00B
MMSKDVVSISLSEWETQSPAISTDLVGSFLDSSPSSQRVVDALNRSRMLRLTELKNGTEVSSFSHVGRVRIGDLNITILPKLKTASLLRLLRYAYGFRRLELFNDSTHLFDQCGFEDLLISQLNAEGQELISRGLQKTYLRQDERLASPRGRINIDRLALDIGTATATLPCQHFPRIEDTLLNRVLLAGLRLAGSIASLLDLRRESRRLASLMEEQVSRINLDATVLNQAVTRLTRLSTSYTPALSIIRLLVESQGIVLEGHTLKTTLPGFLFDMNLFFQALLSRFLKENLVDHTIQDEHGLKGMMRYNPKYNPQSKQSPTPRPDYAIMRQGKLVSLLDAKYRDLWEKSLPREMLYQLVVYAISNRQQLQSSILYPTENLHAKEARINVSDPVYGKHLGQVCLRPVNLTQIEELVSSSTAVARREREKLAKRLAFGAGT